MVAITGLDADGQRVTIRCDGKPVVRGAKLLTDLPRRGRPPKKPADE